MCNPLRKISIKQQTIWCLIGNASISLKIHLGGTVNELTMPHIKCVPTETKEMSSCVSISSYPIDGKGPKETSVLKDTLSQDPECNSRRGCIPMHLQTNF